MKGWNVWNTQYFIFIKLKIDEFSLFFKTFDVLSIGEWYDNSTLFTRYSKGV